MVVGWEVLTCTILCVEVSYDGPVVTSKRYFSGSSFFLAMLSSAMLEDWSRLLRGLGERLDERRADASLDLTVDITLGVSLGINVSDCVDQELNE